MFKQSAEDLGAHMKKEELVLFPFIRNMVESKRRGVELPKPHFGAVENPIEMMKHEHENEGDRFEKIAQLLNQYTPPSDARTPVVHGDDKHNHQAFARITFAAGQSQAVWTHNKNWTNYIVQITTDSPETHLYYCIS